LAGAGHGGEPRGYSWPPFAAGNEAAVTHGANSERRVGPLAERIARELLEDPATPPHVREPVFAASVEAWAHTEAVVRLIRAWLAERDLMAGLAELTTTAEDEERGKVTTRRKSTTRHVGPVLEALRKYETLAANLRGRLGLDPASAARVARDLALTRRMGAAATPLDAALAEIERRRALAEGGAGG